MRMYGLNSDRVCACEWVERERQAGSQEEHNEGRNKYKQMNEEIVIDRKGDREGQGLRKRSSER